VEPGFIQEEYLQNFILIVDDASEALAEVCPKVKVHAVCCRDIASDVA
jgi:hypothetical protein